MYDEAFRPVELSNGQFSMLVAVSVMQPASIQSSADRLGMDRTTVTAALKPLQRRELIAVDVAHDDLRGRAVILTSEGSELLQQAIPLWKAAQSRIASLVGGEESASLMRHKLAAIV